MAVSFSFAMQAFDVLIKKKRKEKENGGLSLRSIFLECETSFSFPRNIKIPLLLVLHSIWECLLKDHFGQSKYYIYTEFC